MEAAIAIERLMSVATENVRRSEIEITNSRRMFLKASLRGLFILQISHLYSEISHLYSEKDSASSRIRLEALFTPPSRTTVGSSLNINFLLFSSSHITEFNTWN